MVKRWLVVREVAGSRLAGSQHKFTTLATMMCAMDMCRWSGGFGIARSRTSKARICGVGQLVLGTWLTACGARR